MDGTALRAATDALTDTISLATFVWIWLPAPRNPGECERAAAGGNGKSANWDILLADGSRIVEPACPLADWLAVQEARFEHRYFQEEEHPNPWWTQGRLAAYFWQSEAKVSACLQAVVDVTQPHSEWRLLHRLPLNTVRDAWSDFAGLAKATSATPMRFKILSTHGRTFRLRDAVKSLAGLMTDEDFDVPVGDSRATPSDDYRSVNWFGTNHNFTTLQAAVVQLLWEHWDRGTPDVAGETLLDKSGSSQRELRFLFKKKGKLHKAWGTMIVPGDRRGTYRLQPPASKNPAAL